MASTTSWRPDLARWRARAGAMRGRLASTALTLLGLLVLTFFIGRVMPVDPVLALVGPDADASMYKEAAARLGVDQPVWVQFGRYIAELGSGNLGTSLLTGNAVTADIARVFPATVELATLAIVLGALAGVPLGVFAATRRGGLGDNVVRVISLSGYSVPVFWFGMMGLLVFYAWLGWVGGSGRIALEYDGVVPRATGLLLVDTALAGNWAAFGNAVKHITLPACILGLHSMAFISRMTRSFMLAQLSQEYVLTARVKGLPEWRVVWQHAFRNILVQLLTIVALAYGGLLEGAVLIETVYAWPGFGQYLTNSLLLGDMNAVMGCVLIVGIIFVTLNLVSDALYKIFDPRMK
ncbi:ABC transporter permease [Massilia litorea]|nr:ABC transporter permease [Massilia litorea]